MDFYDRRILAALRDGEPKEFKQMFREVGCSHNTLRLHLDSLEGLGLVVRQKRPKEGRGRPTFTYGLPRGVRRASSALVDPHTDLVVLSFERLQRIKTCRRLQERKVEEERLLCYRKKK